jgi:hypothetical protein
MYLPISGVSIATQTTTSPNKGKIDTHIDLIYQEPIALVPPTAIPATKVPIMTTQEYLELQSGH